MYIQSIAGLCDFSHIFGHADGNQPRRQEDVGRGRSATRRWGTIAARKDGRALASPRSAPSRRRGCDRRWPTPPDWRTSPGRGRTGSSRCGCPTSRARSRRSRAAPACCWCWCLGEILRHHRADRGLSARLSSIHPEEPCHAPWRWSNAVRCPVHRRLGRRRNQGFHDPRRRMLRRRDPLRALGRTGIRRPVSLPRLPAQRRRPDGDLGDVSQRGRGRGHGRRADGDARRSGSAAADAAVAAGGTARRDGAPRRTAGLRAIPRRTGGTDASAPLPRPGRDRRSSWTEWKIQMETEHAMRSLLQAAVELHGT